MKLTHQELYIIILVAGIAGFILGIAIGIGYMYLRIERQTYKPDEQPASKPSKLFGNKKAVPQREFEMPRKHEYDEPNNL